MNDHHESNAEVLPAAQPNPVSPMKANAPALKSAGRPRANQANRHSRRWLPWMGLVLLLALIVAGFWPRPVLVELATIQVGKLQSTVTEEGKTRVKQRYLVTAPLASRLRRIALDPGDKVKAGETVVAEIEPLPPALLDARSRSLAEARRDAANQNLERARAAHRFATSELERFKKLFAEQTVSIQELEVMKWRDESAMRDEGAAESELREAEATLAAFTNPAPAGDITEVKAPASGRVLRVPDQSARVVSAGQTLLEIGDPTDLEVVIDVLSRDGARIGPGTRIELEHWGGEVPLQARVRHVEPAAFTKVSALGVEEQRVNVIADLVTPPEQRRSLGDQFRVEARIVMWEADQVTKVASGALFRRGQDWATFVVTEGRAHLRTIKVGHASNSEMEILAGLKPGDAVILHPGDRVRDGQRVKPVEI